MYAALIGEVDGVRLISPERLAEATAVSVEGHDEVLETKPGGVSAMRSLDLLV
jgi:hypothetical protein